MGQTPIAIGAAPNDGTGDSFRAAAIKINANIGELYSLIGTIQGAGASYQPLNARLTALANATINGVVIGGTTPAAGTFTTLAVTSLTLGSSTLTGLGTTAGTIAAGNDSRIVGALQASAAATIYAPLASPALTGTPTAPSPAVGTNTPQIATAAMVTAAVAAIPSGTLFPLGQCRLTYSSTTSLLLKPYQGNQIWVNGAYRTIPSAGVSLANTGLTTATLYYIYAFMSGSTLTLEAVTTGHATDSTYGHEIKSGDATRTLVGMAYMADGSPGTFADSTTFRGVASWFNRQGKTLEASVSGASASSTTPTANAALTVTFVTWADEVVQQNASGLSSNNTVGNYSQAQFMIDGVTVGANGAGTNQVSTANYFMNAGMARSGTVSEAAHSATIALSVNGGTGAFSLNHTVGIRQ